nr:LRR receptor-like serine/threonine-protein kinase EFR [Ziziphus jujuba var. spinosa]
MVHSLTSEYASSSTTKSSTDMLALQALKSEIIELPWNPNNNSFCSWVGVSCGQRHQRVTALDLSYMHLQGTISPHVGNLTFLRVINLRNNSFHGPLPNTVGRLGRLRVLNLGYKQLGGIIPELELLENGLTGSIPEDLGCLSQLEHLNLLANQLTGKTPTSLGNLSNLEELNLESNGFSGNNLSGNVPELIGFQHSKLRKLSLHGNRFTGRIPDSISNASMLAVLELSTNLFSGPVPRTLGGLRYLKVLNLQYNKLTNNPSERELNFLSALTVCRQLRYLMIGYNPLNGALPHLLETCPLLSNCSVQD